MTLFDEPTRTFDADPFGDRRASGTNGDGPQALGSRDLSSTGRVTMAGRVAAFFKARPGEWIDGRDLMGIAGSYGWRTRCSDIRRPPFSMTIENRQRRVGKFIVSEYRYVPAPDADLGGVA